MREKEEKAKAKAEEKAKKEAEKAAAGEGAPKKKDNPGAAFDEEEKDPSKYTENRKNFVQGLRDQNINPYPHKFTRTHRIDEFRRDYDEQITEKVFIEDQTVSLTGRIMAIRGAGANLIFIDLEGDGAKVQVMAQSNSYQGEFSALHGSLRRGDIIGVEGQPGRSKTGELSVRPTKIVSLSYCMHMLPKRDTDVSKQVMTKDTRFR